jgi:hypothetical protein
LIRSFFRKPSAKLTNHRSPVLPLFLRPSTQSWDCGYSREKGTTLAFSYTLEFPRATS